MNITFFNSIYENKHKTTYERRSLHDWRGRDSGCPVAKTYCLYLYWFKIAVVIVEANANVRINPRAGLYARLVAH